MHFLPREVHGEISEYKREEQWLAKQRKRMAVFELFLELLTYAFPSFSHCSHFVTHGQPSHWHMPCCLITLMCMSVQRLLRCTWGTHCEYIHLVCMCVCVTGHTKRILYRNFVKIDFFCHQDTVCPSLCSTCYFYVKICVGYIPAKRDIRPVISRGKGQCLSEAKEVPRYFRDWTRALTFPKGLMDLTSLLAGTYTMLRLL